MMASILSISIHATAITLDPSFKPKELAISTKLDEFYLNQGQKQIPKHVWIQPTSSTIQQQGLISIPSYCLVHRDPYNDLITAFYSPPKNIYTYIYIYGAASPTPPPPLWMGHGPPPPLWLWGCGGALLVSDAADFLWFLVPPPPPCGCVDGSWWWWRCWKYVYKYLCVYEYIYMYMYMMKWICTYNHMYIYVYIYTYVIMFMNMYVYGYVSSPPLWCG